jgi:SNF2 family DNA or RNA helicase
MTEKTMPIRATPFEHQRQAYVASINAMESGRSRGYALLMEMGCGKTLVAIANSGRLYQTGRLRRVLVVAPLSILGVWEDEFSKYADFDYTLSVLTGSGNKKADTLRHLDGIPLQVAVVNYESGWRLEADLATWLGKDGGSLIIADEAHKIKTHNTSVSKAMHRLGAKADYRLLLTGTPITNRAIDVFSEWKFLNPSIFGNSFYSWRNRYFDMMGYGNHTPVLKKTMESELTRKMHSIAFRATKAECLDLPDTTDVIRSAELEPQAMKVYHALAKDCIAELGAGEISVTNVLTKLLRLSQLTGGYLTDDDGKTSKVSSAKMDALTDIVEEAANDGRKIVVIARFTAEVDAICAMLEKQGIQYSRIDGSVKDRANQVERFQNDPEVMAFVGQIQVAGVGITLTAASLMVFYSLDYSTANHEQARARIHRAGQTQPCTYYYLQAKNTLDAKVLAALRDKADFAKRMVDDFRNGLNLLG